MRACPAGRQPAGRSAARAGQQRLRRKQLRACGRELDRKRQTVEPHADLAAAGAFSSVTTKSAFTACARSMKSATDSNCGSDRSPAASRDRAARGRALGTRAPRKHAVAFGSSQAALVAARRSADRQAPGPPRQAARRCPAGARSACGRGTPSGCSRSARIGLFDPNRLRDRRQDLLGIGDRVERDEKDALREDLDESAATWRPRRVFPDPPGPVSVNRRTSGRRAAGDRCRTSRLPADQRRRLEQEGWWAGSPASAMVGIVRHPAITSCESRCGLVRSLRRCSPRSRSATPTGSSSSTNSRVVGESSVWPPWAAAEIRAARGTSSPT